MEKNCRTRREFIATSIGTATALIMNGELAAAPAARVRHSVTSREGKLALADYEKAVKAMKALPQTERRYWENQAKVHLGDAVNGCPHSNWYFLPWHRAYVDYFERICADLSGNANFALPYWNWSADPSIPAEFWGLDKTLAHPRDVDQNWNADSSRVGPMVIDRLQQTVNFEEYGSTQATELRGRARTAGLENPHNYVHGAIGKDMGDYLSPRDPIFWLHHCNIDRLWAEWQSAHPKGTPTTAAWANMAMVFPNPKVGNGQPATVKTTPGAVRNIADLGYTYDSVRHVVGALPVEKAIVFASLPSPDSQLAAKQDVARPLVKFGDSVRVELGAPPKVFAAQLAKATDPKAETEFSARLSIDGMRVDPKTTFGVDVYLNSADGGQAKQDDPGYVGTIFFFGLGHQGEGTGHGHGNPGVIPMSRVSAMFNVADTLQKLKAAGRYTEGGKVSVTCTPAPLREGLQAAGQVSFNEFRLEVVGRE